MDHKIKVLFLDIDNTLLDFDAGAAWAMNLCFEKAGLKYRPEMFAVFKEENNKIWRRIELGKLTMDDLFYVRWQTVLRHLGLTADGVEMEKEFRRLLHLSAVPEEGAKDILKYLYKKKYCLCAASNGPYDQQINRLKSADMLKYFTHCFVSERMGMEKPAREFFEGCFAALPGILPEETMIIGDSLTADIAGGRKMGMRTCWYDREKTGRSDEADVTIQNLCIIKKIL